MVSIPDKGLKDVRALIVIPAKYDAAYLFPERMGKPLLTPGAAMAVAAFAREAAKQLGINISCEIWDEHVKGPVMEKKMREFNLCLLTTLTPSRLGSFRVAKIARAWNIPTISGCIDVTGMYKETSGEMKMAEHFDAIYVGHLTVSSFARVLDDLQRGMLKKVYQATPEEAFEFVLPAWELINIDDYMIAGIQSSAGCPYSCDFCGVYLVTGKCQVHNKPRWIIRKELEYLHSQGIQFFVDISDCFGVNKKHYETVMEMYREFKMMWATEISVPVLVGQDGKSGIIDEMAESGCIGVYVGVESLNIKLPKNDPKIVRLAIRRARKLKLLVLASMIIDYDPDATWDQVKKDIKTLMRWGVMFFQFSLVTLIPGTKMRADAISDGQMLTNDPRDFDGSKPTRYHKVSPEERTEWLKACLELAYGLMSSIKIILWVMFNRPELIPTIRVALRSIRTSTRKWDWKTRTAD